MNWTPVLLIAAGMAAMGILRRWTQPPLLRKIRALPPWAAPDLQDWDSAASCRAGVSVAVWRTSWPLSRLRVKGSRLRVDIAGTWPTRFNPVRYHHLPGTIVIRSENITKITQCGPLMHSVFIEDATQPVVLASGPRVMKVLQQLEGLPAIERSTRIFRLGSLWTSARPPDAP